MYHIHMYQILPQLGWLDSDPPAQIDQPFGWLSISTFALLSHLYTPCHKKEASQTLLQMVHSTWQHIGPFH